MNNKLGVIKMRGFTLIELLVVIAIIGILSTVVIASLNSARTKGQEASIKSTLKNIIAQAELAYDAPGDYSNVCTDAKILSMRTSIIATGATVGCYKSTDNKRWAISARSTNDITKSWTVDSTGVSVWNSSDPSGGVNMDWNTAVTTCKATGEKLPSMEQLISFRTASGGLPYGFQNYYYWAGNTLDATTAYDAYMVDGTEDATVKTNTGPHVRCVR